MTIRAEFLSRVDDGLIRVGHRIFVDDRDLTVHVGERCISGLTLCEVKMIMAIAGEFKGQFRRTDEIIKRYGVLQENGDGESGKKYDYTLVKQVVSTIRNKTWVSLIENRRGFGYRINIG